MSIEESFDNLPRRLFLDSCTVQTIGQYGAFIWEGEPLPETDSIHRVEGGPGNLAALRDIFLVNERALFEWFLSEASLAEAEAKHDSRHLRWVHDVMDHTRVCLEESGGPTDESTILASRLNKPCFGYLSEQDRRLIRDAVHLRCDAFLTMEQRLPRNPAQLAHMVREVGLQILRPVDYWERLRPWAALYR